MNTFTIVRKELSSYFRSPVAYAVLFFFALITGFFFYTAVRFFLQQSLQSTLTGQSVPLNVNEWVVRNVLSNMNVINLFVIPILTMRLFAEEKRSGTFELLSTSPLRDWEIILGKWLSAMVLYLAGVGVSILNMLVLFAYGSPDWKPLMVGYLGLLLQGGALLARRFDARTFQFRNDPIQIADRLAYYEPAGLAQFSISDNGVLVRVGDTLEFMHESVLDYFTAIEMSSWAIDRVIEGVPPLLFRLIKPEYRELPLPGGAKVALAHVGGSVRILE